MSSFFLFSLSLPAGAFTGYLLEKRQCFRGTFVETSVGQYLRSRVSGYAIMSWLGFAFFVALLWTSSHGLSMVDTRSRTNHNDHWAQGAFLGTMAGLLLGCGLAGSMLNYGQLRITDSFINNQDLNVQLMSEENTESVV